MEWNKIWSDQSLGVIGGVLLLRIALIDLQQHTNNTILDFISILDIINNLESSEDIVCTGSDLQIFSRTLFDKRLFDKRVTKFVGQPTWQGAWKTSKI